MIHNFTATVYGGGGTETLRITGDSWVLQSTLEAMTDKFNWVWEKEWTGNELRFESQLGTQQQFENGFLGRIVIQNND